MTHDINDFDFVLPKELIAQQPAKERSGSRMLRYKQGQMHHMDFANIVDEISSQDVLVLNRSKVINSKFHLDTHTHKLDSSGNVEIYLQKSQDTDPSEWTAYAKPYKKLKIGDVFGCGDGYIKILDKIDSCDPQLLSKVVVKFDIAISLQDFLEKYGHMPLPPYIKRATGELRDLDNKRYQTIYAQNPGSVAAPTAGLHFTQEIIDKLLNKMVKIVYIDLHVGAGTFLPIKTHDINQHIMHTESYDIDSGAAHALNQAINNRQNIICVGTTSLRAVESAYKDGSIVAGSGETNIFIKPGFQFQVATSLITNFHLPKSTLFVLFCAAVGIEEAKNIYSAAIALRYRFFSYGDCVFVNLGKK